MYKSRKRTIKIISKNLELPVETKIDIERELESHLNESSYAITDSPAKFAGLINKTKILSVRDLLLLNSTWKIAFRIFFTINLTIWNAMWTYLIVTFFAVPILDQMMWQKSWASSTDGYLMEASRHQIMLQTMYPIIHIVVTMLIAIITFNYGFRRISKYVSYPKQTFLSIILSMAPTMFAAYIFTTSIIPMMGYSFINEAAMIGALVVTTTLFVIFYKSIVSPNYQNL